jgi:DUF4097 and DUF4098 domain-containing protein YvlB
LAAPFLGQARAAEGRTELERSVTPDVEITVENAAGSIEVTGWQDQKVSIRGQLGQDVERLAVEGDASKLSIRAIRNHAAPSDRTALELHVPRGARVRVQSASADIHVSGLVGAISCHSASGSQTIIDADSPEIDARTVSGTLLLSGSAKRLSIESVSGAVRWRGKTESLKASTVSGGLEIQELGSPSQIALRTVSGAMHIDGLAAATEAEMSSTSGDVVLSLKPGVPVEITASTMSGHLHGFSTTSEPSFGPGRRAKFSSGTGGAAIRIRTLSGDVDLRGG